MPDRANNSVSRLPPNDRKNTVSEEQIQKAEPGEESKLAVRRRRERDSEHHLDIWREGLSS